MDLLCFVCFYRVCWNFRTSGTPIYSAVLLSGLLGVRTLAERRRYSFCCHRCRMKTSFNFGKLWSSSKKWLAKLDLPICCPKAARYSLYLYNLFHKLWNSHIKSYHIKKLFLNAKNQLVWEYVSGKTDMELIFLLILG